ncbi:glycine betaine ABC transporter substrate-binding protein [Arthrobacter sp. NPDC056727]|uniref:glycine betaine ABC transporter substrate-binding protein n=1 Tax=Arthrobacter sp. NPDC056727 TaxID=3345927 RepID=UPI0036725C0B
MSPSIRPLKVLQAALVAAALAVTTAGCSNSTQAAGSATTTDKTVTIGVNPYDEVLASSYLWKDILEEEGYTVKLEQLDVAPLYSGVATGQLDFFFGAVPLTHKDYWDRFSKDFNVTGQWYDTLRQGVVVPEYSDAKTVADLKSKSSEFGGKIIGIESGSGLMAQTKAALTKYDLSGYNLIEGSTPAMLAALDRSIKNKEPVAVTLWQPHWAFQKYQLRLLDDPEGVYPPNDTFKVITSKKFAKNEDVTKRLARFHMTAEQLQSLEIVINQAGQGKEQDAVKAWIKDNQAAVDTWKSAS